MNDCVLITGGAGFLSQHLTRRLVGEGRRVVTYDLSFPVAKPVDEVQVRGDVTDVTSLAEAVRTYDVTAIVHLATLLTEACARDPVRAAQVNCVGTAAVFDVAARLGIQRVLFGSSVAVFSHGDGPTGDDRPLAPPGVYGATKAFAEHLAGAMMCDHPRLELVGLRFGWIYGPGRVRGWNALQDMIVGFALERERVAYPAYVDANDWTYVGDAVEAIVHCLTSPRPSVVAYNVSGDRRTVGEAVAHLQRRFPRVRAEPVPARLPPNAWDFRSERITTEAGYMPTVRLEAGLDLTTRALRQMHDLPPLAATPPH